VWLSLPLPVESCWSRNYHVIFFFDVRYNILTRIIYIYDQCRRVLKCIFHSLCIGETVLLGPYHLLTLTRGIAWFFGSYLFWSSGSQLSSTINSYSIFLRVSVSLYLSRIHISFVSRSFYRILIGCCKYGIIYLTRFTGKFLKLS